MDINALNTGHKIAGVAGLLTIINLWLPWYGVDFGNQSINFNAWDAKFSAWGGSLFIIAAAAVLLSKAFGKADINRGTLKAEQIALGLAGIGTILILLRWISDNDFTKFGLYFGILLALATLAGSFLAMKESGIALPTMNDIKTLADDSDGTA